MGSAAPATVQGTIEAALVAALGSLTPPWQLSRLTWHQFPGADPLAVEALAFAVGLEASSAVPPGRQSRGAADHTPVETEVGVRFTSRIRPDAAVEDYRVALEREAVLVRSCLGIQQAPLTWRGVERSVVADGTLFLGDLRFSCYHYYPI